MPIQTDFDLRPFNTFGLPARTRFFAPLSQVDELKTWRANPQLSALPWHVLGGGSNLLLTGDLEAFVIKVELKGKSLISEGENAWIVRAAGGENWHDFVMWTLENGWGGLENLALIPGTVGAAPVQNIGAYGAEAGDYLASLTAIDLTSGEAREFTAQECAFAYRDSIFKQSPGRWLISEVIFRLPKNHQPKTSYGEIEKELSKLGGEVTPRTVAQAVINVRMRKLPDPAEIGNAGSFFKNPVVAAAQRDALLARYPALVSYPQTHGGYKLAAGWLIDQAGWKGKRLGPAGMYEKQALVMVNHGGATGKDVLALMAAVQKEVFAQFGVELEAEPVRW
jgi:UDP-N-acetylmuramate dehydrogenase